VTLIVTGHCRVVPGDADLEKFQWFTRAIREKRVLRFVYGDMGKWGRTPE
jgi:hypothetical protein